MGIANEINHGAYGLAAMALIGGSCMLSNWKLNSPVVQFNVSEIAPARVTMAHKTFLFCNGVRMQTMNVNSENNRIRTVNRKNR